MTTLNSTAPVIVRKDGCRLQEFRKELGLLLELRHREETKGPLRLRSQHERRLRGSGK